jgi:hypothetical protein
MVGKETDLLHRGFRVLPETNRYWRRKDMKKPKLITVLTSYPFPLVIITAIVAASMLAFTGNAWAAKDDLEVKVISSSQPIAAISTAVNTSTSSPITIDYNLVGTSFPTGTQTFGTISVGMEIVDKSASNPTNHSTSYPLTVALVQQGSGNQPLLLTANPGTYNNLNGPGEFGPSIVTITTNCEDDDACPPGQPLSATLQFNGPGGNDGLNTSVNITVRITLVEPEDTACLGLASFVTNQGRNIVVNSTEVVTVRSGKNAGKVNSTTPFGQHSYNVLVVNTCAEEADAFDLKITLDPSYDTNPSNNPGNAVFTYLAEGPVDLEGFDIENFSQKTPQGQTLCLQNFWLDGDETFLATVHMGIQRGIHQDTLPGANTAETNDDKFTFKAEIFDAGTGCTGTAWESDTAYVGYTIK